MGDVPGAGCSPAEALLAEIRAAGRLPDPGALRGLVLAGADLSGLDLSRADLAGLDLRGANLSGANLFRADLSGSLLDQADLEGADLTGANLAGACLEGARGTSASLGMACLRDARLFQADLAGASLAKADLAGADCRCTRFAGARLREADLRGGDFQEAELAGADLSLAAVARANFNNADLRRARLRMLKGYEKASWLGADIRDINFAGGYLLRRFIMDQNYLKEFRDRNRFTRVVHFLWWVTSDCGRSMPLWCLWIAVQTFFFAGLYTLVRVDYGRYPTPLSPLYYSVVTLTTLGYGDVVPSTLAGQCVAMLEVMVGYMMLGGLLSIFANKMARRSE
ncbi:hypothetical protein G3N55_09580 [Dissulfurirhabdus thermomarina]|uniref:Potassium channel domain-containing protein n=1 Tax=Dissulfurirhabdus thermomarina TaxID=1765737 RepID=A0A6N9TRN2_DISTH|nr:pentapeptide repeat-containing protein [Dissulfurirhabdus thermomarina]NDY43090.1 hypothetical protein [Dissulfurirhabdus thermomarina]NMX22693.1 hypothetical protein [Dissulfurirhabdus thermomarina]